MSDIQIVIALFSGFVTIVSGYLGLNKLQTRRLTRLSNILFATLKEDVKVANERATNAETQLKQLQDALHSAELRLTRLDTLQSEVNVLTASLSSVQTRVVELEKKNAELDTALTSTLEEKHRLEGEIETKSRQIADLELQNQTLQKVFGWMGMEYSQVVSKMLPVEQSV